MAFHLFSNCFSTKKGKNEIASQVCVQADKTKRKYLAFKGAGLETIPSMTYTSEPTSPSLMMQLSLPYSTGYIQSTISWICDSSKFFIKSLSRMASLMRSLDLGQEREDLLVLSEFLRVSTAIQYSVPAHYKQIFLWGIQQFSERSEIKVIPWLQERHWEIFLSVKYHLMNMWLTSKIIQFHFAEEFFFRKKDGEISKGHFKPKTAT